MIDNDNVYTTDEYWQGGENIEEHMILMPHANNEMPFNIMEKDGNIQLYYSNKIDITIEPYYVNRFFLIDLIKIKRNINDFIANNLENKNYIVKLTDVSFLTFFYLIVPMLDRTDKDVYLQNIFHDYEECMSDDDKLAMALLDICIGSLSIRIERLYNSVPLGILYKEFLRIVDASIDYFSVKQTMSVKQFIEMFISPPKLMNEQWDPTYCCAICKYPWSAHDLVFRLEEFMKGKKDKEALLYVAAAIEAKVVHRSWKRFKSQFGEKYCSRKTYNQYTDSTKIYTYYQKEELAPLISFFEDYRPNGCK